MFDRLIPPVVKQPTTSMQNMFMLISWIEEKRKAGFFIPQDQAEELCEKVLENRLSLTKAIGWLQEIERLAFIAKKGVQKDQC